jgi:hypothetical protein
MEMSPGEWKTRFAGCSAAKVIPSIPVAAAHALARAEGARATSSWLDSSSALLRQDGQDVATRHVVFPFCALAAHELR